MTIHVTPADVIPDDDLEWEFIPVAARNRLRALAGQRILADGTILITARNERSQEQNRRDAEERLAALVRSALVEPKVRRKTRPTKASKERRIDSKKRRSETKQGRGRAWD